MSAGEASHHLLEIVVCFGVKVELFPHKTSRKQLLFG